MEENKLVVEFSFKTIFVVLGSVLAIWLAITLKDVLVTVLLAFILAMAISPLVDKLQSKKVPRMVSVIGVILAVIGTIYLVIRLIVPPFVTELTNILNNRTEYVIKISSYFQHLSPVLRNNMSSFLDNFFGSFNNLNVGGLVSGAKGFFNGVIELVLVLVLCFYLLQSKKGVEDIVLVYVPKPYQKRVITIFRKITNKMSRWMRGQILLGIIIFIINLIGLTVLKVNYALTLAVISGLLEVLPIIGPIVAGGLAVLIALTQSPVLALIVLAWYVLVQQAENHILVPQIMKKSLGLNPIAIIVAILVGGKLMGIIGILIAVPVTAAIGVLLEEFVKKVETEAV